LSQPPSFISDLLYNADGIELREYDGQSLAGYVESPEDTSGLTFQKEDGPDWLNVAGDDTLSGIPLHSNVGENIFTVRVENRMGIFDIVTMAINVMNTYSGTQGMEDLLGFAAQWLALNCGLCGGADLDGDANVTISDFAILAHNWLVEWDDLPLTVPL